MLCMSSLIQVTYLLSGETAHEDSCGHSGTLEPGDLQVRHMKLEIIYRKQDEKTWRKLKSKHLKCI